MHYLSKTIVFCILISSTVYASFNLCTELILSRPESDVDVVNMINKSSRELSFAEIKGLLKFYDMGEYFNAELIPKVGTQKDVIGEFKSSVSNLQEALSRKNYIFSTEKLTEIITEYIWDVSEAISSNRNSPENAGAIIEYSESVNFRETMETALLKGDNLPTPLKSILPVLNDLFTQVALEVRYPLISALEVNGALVKAADSLSSIFREIEKNITNQEPDRDLIFKSAQDVMGVLSNQGLVWHACSVAPQEFIKIFVTYREILPVIAKMGFDTIKFATIVSPMLALREELLAVRTGDYSGWEQAKASIEKNWHLFGKSLAIPAKIDISELPEGSPFRISYSKFLAEHPDHVIKDYLEIMAGYLIEAPNP